MNQKSKKIFLLVFLLIIVVGGVVSGLGYYHLLSPQFHPEQNVYIYIDRDDTADSVIHKIETMGNPKTMTGFKLFAKKRDLDKNVRTGKYVIKPGDSAYQLYSRISRGYKEPVNLTVGSTRTLDQLSRSLGRQLMIDSTEIATVLNNPSTIEALGYTNDNISTLIIPDTYQVYWDISAEELLERLNKEHARFWNDKRLAQAEAIGMTPDEVCTLASIVDEETNNNPEKPIVAGLYINRLKKGIPLQADPTVKYALKDFGLRRITNEHLKYDSPYNTYLNAGLPPGPIRIPTKQGIESVLNYAQHDYIYMCAKEDLSGTHNFAATYGEHMRNARKYWNALNERKIFK